jgi:hypothetical protein
LAHLLAFLKRAIIKRADLALPGSATGYLRDRNSVEDIPFEVIKPIVKVKATQVISE